MVQFGLARHQVLCHLDDWVVVSERSGVAIAAQLWRYEHLLTLLQLEDELGLNELNSQQRAFDEEYVDQLTTSKHEFNVVESTLNDFSVELISEFDSS